MSEKIPVSELAEWKNKLLSLLDNTKFKDVAGQDPNKVKEQGWVEFYDFRFRDKDNIKLAFKEVQKKKQGFRHVIMVRTHLKNNFTSLYDNFLAKIDVLLLKISSY